MQLRQFPESAPLTPAPAVRAQRAHRKIIFVQPDDHRFDLLGALARPDDKLAIETIS